MKELFFKYLQHGVQRHDHREAQRVRLTHGIYVTLGLITAPYAVIFELLGVRALAVGVVPIATIYLAAPLVTAWFGFSVTRAIQFTLFPMVIALYSSCLGEGTNIHLLYFPAVGLPFLVASTRERRLLSYGVAMPILFYGALLASRFTLFGEAALSAQVQTWVGYGLVPTTFAILLSAVAFFAISTERAQARLDQRTNEMGLVLENVNQALVTVDRTGALSTERSGKFGQWFGPPRAADTLWTVLGRVDSRIGEPLSLGFSQLIDDVLPLEVALEQLPSRFEADGRTFHLSLTPVGQAPHQRFLAVISDVSADVARALAEADQADFARAVRHLTQSRGPFLEAIAELRALVERLPGETGPLQLRTLHTIKGNAAVWGLDQLARAAHACESGVLEGGLTGEAATAAVTERFGHTLAPLEPLLRNVDSVEVARAELDTLLTHFANGEVRLAHQLAQQWQLEPLAPRFERLAEEAHALAKRLGRSDVNVRVSVDGLRLPAALTRQVTNALVHLVRNAVDHGLEAPFERDALAKPTTAVLDLDARLHDGALEIRVRDDGRGIDWEAVRRRAADQRLPSGKHADLVEALFADGLSTRDEASEISGRGVGLAAVRATVRALGGELTVTSQAHQGTTFQLRIPVAQGAVPVSGSLEARAIA